MPSLTLTLALAETIVDGAIAEARRRSYMPLGVAVLDAGGHVVVIKREDGASLFRTDIATAKAKGALGMGFSSRELAKRSAAQPLFYTALFAMSGGEMAPSPGGVLIRGEDGTILGAVGASGDVGDSDETAVMAGITAAGLHFDAPPSA
jgi:uncharacterized protein GlcG (DUF336 family)